MVQSPSWEANWYAASQEITRISRNPNVHYRTHKRPPPVSIQGQANPVHIPISHLLEIHPNIIHPSRPRSLQLVVVVVVVVVVVMEVALVVVKATWWEILCLNFTYPLQRRMLRRAEIAISVL